MIALTPQVHRSWSRGYFGFQCQGIVPGTSSTTITLQMQMRWMKRSNVKDLSAKHAVDLTNEREDVLDELKSVS